MYINYIQKYVNATRITKKMTGGPLEKSLQKAIQTMCSMAKKNNYEVGIVISPGYLSTKLNTANHLVSDIIQKNNVSHCWILGTMNGNNMNGNNKILNFTIKAFSQVSTIATQPNLIKSTGFAKDHRKMFFIVLWKKNKGPLTLKSKKNVSNFINNIVVPVATIGSSNFSKSTYFMGNDHNEADILWIDDDVLNTINNTNNSNFNDDIIYREYYNGNFPTIVSAKVYSLKTKNYLRLILEETLNTVLI